MVFFVCVHVRFVCLTPRVDAPNSASPIMQATHLLRTQRKTSRVKSARARAHRTTKKVLSRCQWVCRAVVSDPWWRQFRVRWPRSRHCFTRCPPCCDGSSSSCQVCLFLRQGPRETHILAVVALLVHVRCGSWTRNVPLEGATWL